MGQVVIGSRVSLLVVGLRVVGLLVDEMMRSNSVNSGTAKSKDDEADVENDGDDLSSANKGSSGGKAAGGKRRMTPVGSNGVPTGQQLPQVAKTPTTCKKQQTRPSSPKGSTFMADMQKRDEELVAAAMEVRPSNSSRAIRMKIKRQRMETRQSGARHEVVSVPPDDTLEKAVNAAVESVTNSGRTADESDSEDQSGFSPVPAPHIPPPTSDSRQAATPPPEGNIYLSDKRDCSTWVRSVATSTDESLMGACEPGTSVALEGIVWSENPSAGLLVVNVTWRDRTYVGSLLDLSKYNYAPPRVCESPNLDPEHTARGLGKGGRCSKRSCAVGSGSQRSGGGAGAGELTTNGASTSKAAATAAAAARLSSPRPVLSTVELERHSPLLFQCCAPKCTKKFSVPHALVYHQCSAHAVTPPKTPDLLSKDQKPQLEGLNIKLELNPQQTVQVKPGPSDSWSQGVVDLGTGEPRSAPAAQSSEGLSAVEEESLDSLFRVVGSGQRPQHLPRMTSVVKCGRWGTSSTVKKPPTRVRSPPSSDSEFPPVRRTIPLAPVSTQSTPTVATGSAWGVAGPSAPPGPVWSKVEPQSLSVPGGDFGPQLTHSTGLIPGLPSPALVQFGQPTLGHTYGLGPFIGPANSAMNVVMNGIGIPVLSTGAMYPGFPFSNYYHPPSMQAGMPAPPVGPVDPEALRAHNAPPASQDNN
ncbi:Zinc finger protein [Trichinella sp. T6]|nr:Zinc finger protein [Trichinella sp. T6]